MSRLHSYRTILSLAVAGYEAEYGACERRLSPRLSR